MLRFVGLVVLGGIIGGVAALAAAGFVGLVLWLNDVLLMSPRGRMMFAHPEWLVVTTILVPVVGGLVVGQLHRAIPERRPHGPADAIAAVQTRRGRLPFRAGVLSMLSALASLGSGASVGQYGPLVHMGASLGSLGAKVLRLGRSDDNVAIACGVAAVIATAFHAPLAGIVFAHEVILRHYALRAFSPVAAAAIVGYVIANDVLAQGALFHVNDTAVPQAWEFGLFIIIGGFGALVSGAYMHAILAVGRWAGRLPLIPSLRPAVAGSMLGLMALWVPDILGMGKETLRFATIEGAFGSVELAIVLLLKIAATALCLGMGFGGGVFSPALVIGTLFGALCGTLVNAVGLATDTYVFYAVCGMVAVTAPVIGAPLTTLLIVFELTGNYVLTTAALASVTLASPIAAQLFGRSLFDIQLAERGLDLSAGRSQAVLKGARLKQLLSHDCVTLHPEQCVNDAISLLSNSGHTEAHLVDDGQHYQGSLTLVHLEAMRGRGWGDRLLRDCPREPRPVLGPETSVWTAMQYLQEVTGEAIAVVDDSNDDAFLGVVYETSIARAYLNYSAELRREEHGVG
ncbi:chloride channel protein [Halomonas binhaiensis]|uniref:Chloride channel protein n=1 Tax=Halomonas binhaiensis TaxID=2562282 RepID=A0A5C1NIU9_9GAMM|nr:chloride channel protein [Halomonas binhaiensis]QEM82563.1 chloride channel protein [Halomonas binhaiensis]